jgi:hypothetical protein
MYVDCIYYLAKTKERGERCDFLIFLASSWGRVRMMQCTPEGRWLGSLVWTREKRDKKKERRS